MKTRHPPTWPSTWPRFLQVRAVLSTHRDDLCPYLWLQSGHCVCLWQYAAIVCALHVNIYWQAAPCCTPVPVCPLPAAAAAALDNAERKIRLWWRRLARHFKWLFCCWLTKKKPTAAAAVYSLVTAAAEGIRSFTPTQNWSSTLWAAWKNPVLPRRVNIFQGQ